jgi:hypothetical protein
LESDDIACHALQTCTSNAADLAIADHLNQHNDPELLLFVAQYRNPATDPAYKTSIKFPPPGKGKCFCFPCPTGFKPNSVLTATGAAALNSPAAACLPTLSSCSLLVRYQLTASRSGGNPCAAVATAAAGKKLLAALKQRTNVKDNSIVMFSNCTVAKVGGPQPLQACHALCELRSACGQVCSHFSRVA